MPLPRTEAAVDRGGAGTLHLRRGREARSLFASDAVFHGGKVVLQNSHDCSIQKSAASIFKLAEPGFESLRPGHAALAADACRQLFVPKNRSEGASRSPPSPVRRSGATISVAS